LLADSSGDFQTANFSVMRPVLLPLDHSTDNAFCVAESNSSLLPGYDLDCSEWLIGSVVGSGHSATK